MGFEQNLAVARLWYIPDRPFKIGGHNIADRAISDSPLIIGIVINPLVSGKYIKSIQTDLGDLVVNLHDLIHFIKIAIEIPE